MLDLSVLILARNEEKNIGDCIMSIKTNLDTKEIIVIDDFSTDSTCTIAEKLGAVIFHHAFANDTGQQRRFAISRAKAEYIFFIDADERVTAPLGIAISKAVTEMAASGKKNSYLCARLNHFCGEPIRHLGWFPDYCLRLMPKDGASSSGLVHESITSSYPSQKFSRDAYLTHYTYTSWEQYLEKLNRYTSLGAKSMYENGKRGGILSTLSHMAFGFLKMYILELGFLDGRIGLLLSLSHTMSVFMKHTKLYYLEKTSSQNFVMLPPSITNSPKNDR